MSTPQHPVGRQPQSVYRRRRLVVGLGLVALIVVIVLLIAQPWSSKGSPATKSDKPAATGSTSTAAAEDATALPTESAQADGKACKASDIQVTAITDKEGYNVGENPQLSVSVVNNGSKPCVFSVGSSQQVFTITSGDEVYWLSTDCQTDPVDATVTLQPGKPLGSASPLTWDRTRSAKDTCDSQREQVPAGGASYHLTVEVDGVKSEPRQFLLY